MVLDGDLFPLLQTLQLNSDSLEVTDGVVDPFGLPIVFLNFCLLSGSHEYSQPLQSLFIELTLILQLLEVAWSLLFGGV